MHSAGGAAACLRLGFANASGLRLELARKAGSLLRILGEKRFELRIVHRVCRFLAKISSGLAGVTFREHDPLRLGIESGEQFWNQACFDGAGFTR